MKILQMSAYTDRVGGAEIYMHELADELERRGHTVGRFGTSPERDVNDETVRVVKRPAFDPGRLIRDEEVTTALRDFIERIDPEVIHVHNLYSLAVDVDRLLADCGRPVVQTVHDFSTLCPNAWCVYPDGELCEGGAGAKCFAHDCGDNYPYDARMVLVTRLRHHLLRSLVRVMICPSRYLADRIASHGFTDVRHLFYFVDAENLELPEMEREPRSLLYLGRLDPEKGINDLIDAMPHILRQVPETRLTVVGDGSCAEALRAQARTLGLEDHVTFQAKVPYDRVKTYYATATLKILPSIWCENSPLTAYECMVAGLPMIGSRIGGIPDLIVDGETGYLVEPRNPADLADKTVRLLRAPEERDRMSEQMRDRARLFTRKKNVDSVEQIYQEVLAPGPGTAGAAVDSLLDDDLMTTLHQVLGDLRSIETGFHGLLDRLRALEAKGGSGTRLRRLLQFAAGKLGVTRR